MDLNNIPLVGWLVIAVVVYELAVIVISLATLRLFGPEIQDRELVIIAFPNRLVYQLVISLVGWWKKRRDRRLLLETFGLNLEVVLEEGTTAENQKLVNQRLVQLARDMESAFSWQYKVREDTRTTGVQVTQQIAQANHNVRHAKQCFWKTHALAQRFGFVTHRRYQDYLGIQIPSWVSPDPVSVS